MSSDPSTALSAEEFAALGEAEKGHAQDSITHEQVQRLVELGYVIRRLGTVSMTAAGSLRLANGK